MLCQIYHLQCVFSMVCLVLFLPKPTSGSGKLQLYLQTYEFDLQGRASTDPPGEALNFNLSVPLSFAENYKPEWKFRTVFGQVEEDSTSTVPTITEVDETKVTQWPWQEKTDCNGPTTRYRFVICVDYDGSYDPSYPCRLARVETDLFPISRFPFSYTERLAFRTMLRSTRGSNVVPNPFDLQFDEWKGPVRLSIFVTCCGASSIHEGQCDEVLTSTIASWPRAANEGTQTLRYRMEGRASMTVIANPVCDENYYGHHCDKFCQVKKPGTEHAFCNATTGIKQCLPGYEGPDCQVDVDECQSQGHVCKNGGVCKNSPGSFSCSCPFSTTGRTCEQRYAVCHLRPCQHQGTCVETTSGSLCLCMPGFEGQWCHMLEGQEDQRSESPQIRNENDEVATAPGTVTFSRPNASETEPALTRKPHEQHGEGNWQDWYLALIFGIIFLIVMIFIIVFLVCRRRARKRYQVTTDSAALTNMSSTSVLPPPQHVIPVTQAARAMKSRSFNNAVYDDEEHVAGTGSPTTSSFHIFLNNSNGSVNNLTSSLVGNSDDTTYGNSTSITLSNNNILSAKALMQQDSTGKVNFKDKTLVKPKSMDEDGFEKDGSQRQLHHKEHGQPSGSAYKSSGVPNSKGAYGKQPMEATGSRDNGTFNRSDGYVNQSKPLVVDMSKKNANRESNYPYNRSPESKAPRVYQSRENKGATRREMGQVAPRSGEQEESVDVRSVKPSDRAGRNRSQVGSARHSEHDYEDIDAAYTLGPHAPRPKPRSIHNVRSETLRRKDYMRSAGAESDDSLPENDHKDEIDLPLAPPPPPLLSATAVAAVAFSSRVQGQPRSIDTQSPGARPVSIRYEQPRNSDGTLDYSPSDFSLPSWPSADSPSMVGSQKWYGDQYVKSSPDVLMPTDGGHDVSFSDTGSIYCLQQSQRRSKADPANPDPRQSIRQQWGDKWRNQPILPPAKAYHPSGFVPSTNRESRGPASAREWPQSSPGYNSSPSQNLNHRSQPASGDRGQRGSDLRPDSGYVSNQDPILAFRGIPGGRRGSVDALLSDPEGYERDGLDESRRSRSGDALHSYGDSYPLPMGYTQPRRSSEPFVGVFSAHPRSSIPRQTREAAGCLGVGGGVNNPEARRRGSQHGSGHGGSSLSIVPNVSSSFV